MSDWVHQTIGDLCDAGIVELSTGPFGSQLHAHDYVSEGVPVVPTEAIRSRQIDESVLPNISEAKAAELHRHKLERGDILFARRGVQATGHVGFVRESQRGFLCGTGAIRLRVRPGAQQVSADFLSHVLAASGARRWLKWHAIGATMPNLNEAIVRSFPLRIPPVPEQEAIASMLGALDDKIALNRRLPQTLDDLATVLFSGSDFHELDIDGVVPLSAQIDILTGGTPKTDVAEYWGGGVPWVSVVDLEQRPFVADTEKTITQAGILGSAAKPLPDRTIVISARGTVGRVAMTTGEMAINQSCYGLRSRAGAQYYLYQLIRAHVQTLRAGAHGSVFDTITRRSFESVMVGNVPERTMRNYEELVAPLYALALVNQQQARTLEGLRDLLVPKLISGELRIGDAEELAEAVR